jgi:ABC-2 type transport system permease protein
MPGTWTLTRLALRRDRLMIGLWVATIGLLVTGTAASFADLYPTPASRLSFARGIEANPGLMALTGRGFDLTTTGGLVAWRLGGSGALLVAILSLLLVTRHTRAEEESNRLELLGSGVVGRAAPLAAAVVTALLADVAVAVVVTVGLVAAGLPVGGSLALGLSYLACGIVFAGVGAVTAQLTESARAANGLGSAVAGLAFLLRAAGDSTDARWLSWLSPIGWSQQVRAFAGERWWVLAPALVAATGLTAAGAALAVRRDLGEGALPVRPGPARAAAWLRSPTALAWRLQRGSLLGWVLGYVVLGAVVGGLAQSVPDLAEGSDRLRDALHRLGGGSDVVDTYLAGMMGFAGLATAAYAVQAMLRPAGEEAAGRAEALLATPVSRIRWAAGHLALAQAGSLALLGVLGLTAGLVRGLATGDLGGQLPRVLAAALVQVFAVWVFAGLTLALFGLAPHRAGAAWGALVGAVLVGFVGAFAGFDQWVLDLSPFTHLPKLPGGPMNWTPVGALLAVTAGSVAVGLGALSRRDVG